MQRRTHKSLNRHVTVNCKKEILFAELLHEFSPSIRPAFPETFSSRFSSIHVPLPAHPFLSLSLPPSPPLHTLVYKIRELGLFLS